MSRWYKLDNAAKLFPAVTSGTYSSVFRVSAVLTEKIDKTILQKAVDHIFKRFPMLFLQMHKGVFWNYFDTGHDRFNVLEEKDSPCATINPRENNGYLLRILYFGNRVSVEVFHSLTDGGGAVEFFKTLLFYYFKFTGRDIEDEGKVILAEDGVATEEMEDSFSQYYRPEKQLVKPIVTRAFKIKGTPLTSGGCNVVTGIVPASELIKLAKGKNATVTSYLTALLMHSIYKEQQKYSQSNKPIAITVPVNLRKVFPSKSLRNFFVAPNVSSRIGSDTDFDELVADVTRKLKTITEKTSLQTLITDNVSMEKRIYSRFVPLSIKKVLIKIGADILGESRNTMTISNLGSVSVPSGFLQNIKLMEMNLYPTSKTCMNCAVCSLGDNLAISFSRSVMESDIIRCFFKSLAENGLSIEICSNDWGMEYE